MRCEEAIGGAGANFFTEVWDLVRPYAIRMITDFLLAVLLWILLWLFEVLRTTVPIEGWPGRVLADLHALGAVLTLAILIFQLLKTMIAVHKDQ